MSDAAAKLMVAILELSEADRIAIRDTIEFSLKDDEGPEWEAELERRWQGFVSGERPGIPADVVHRELRAEFNLPHEGAEP